ncbi:hypothetical protein DLJ49_09830 [Rhodovulum sp. 12E13]|nr:hypothetical protein DLJ49_09830 [Rhodovulum sp. 12E13]
MGATAGRRRNLTHRADIIVTRRKTVPFRGPAVKVETPRAVTARTARAADAVTAGRPGSVACGKPAGRSCG